MTRKKYNAISLFTGAGGMDVSFSKAGFKILWANEINKDAAQTFIANHPKSVVKMSDIKEVMTELKSYRNIDLVFGGPPCQGFSVAGKMDPNDERSQLIWEFLKVVEIVNPKAFVMENVKALGTLDKWAAVRSKIKTISSELGYYLNTIILNSVDFGVPQKRERVFFIGTKTKISSDQLESLLEKYKEHPPKIKDVLKNAGKFGSESNPITSRAKITLAAKPVMRKSPYAGMLFNGAGRPLNLEAHANTLPATMGGNKTPIVDEDLLWEKSDNDWVKSYHAMLVQDPTKAEYKEAPKRLRRLTIVESAMIQSFPRDYEFKGSKSSVYKQIGNAVPPKLAQALAQVLTDVID